jgi:hypothetical protein
MQSPEESQLLIPNRYHFVWFGAQFPAANRVAIESCLARCQGAQVTLWHSDELSQHADYRALLDAGLRVERLDTGAIFAALAEAHQRAGAEEGPLDVVRLQHIWCTVRSHVSRSNLARAIVLYLRGGIYLDLDVLVVRDLLPLRRYPAFVGSEHIVWPGWACRGVSVQRLVKSPLLDLLRKVTVALPEGERLFQRTAGWYPRAVNGAVLGARAGHPFLSWLLQRTSEVPEAEWQLKHRLGTHVLQRSEDGYPGTDLMILPPEAFFPLGPVVSRQYFRQRERPEQTAQRIVGPETYALHWYSSVTDITAFSSEELSGMARRSVYGHLCSAYTAPPAAAE